jgi:stage III sporulation protein AA
MFEKLFPKFFLDALNSAPVSKMNEIRLRVGKKVVVTIGGKSYFLAQTGLTGDSEKAIVTDKNFVFEVFKNACENSVYAFSQQIKNGFVTVEGGVRIGICGEAVWEKGAIKTFKNISSLVVRIPREVKGCSLPIFKALFAGNFQNTLIVSPPGAGKTTLIRDIIFQLSQKNYCYNILLADERFEVANSYEGVASLDVGNFCDVMSGASKHYAFENGIRSLRPDIIVCDEVAGERDYNSLLMASSCGVKLLASIHAKDLEDLKRKKDFEELLSRKIFTRFVVLSSREGPGTIEGVFDENMRYIVQ